MSANKTVENIGGESVRTDLNSGMTDLKSSIDHFMNDVDESDKCVYFDQLLDQWPLCDVVTAFASYPNLDWYQFAGQISKASHLQYRPRKIRTIATYYYSVSNGGTERVMSSLCYLWLRMGYRVILITEDIGQKEEYDFPEGIKRVILPDYHKSEGSDFLERAKVLEQCIRENQVDVVVYHAWTLKLALLDEMIIKAMGAAFVFHCHNIFTITFLSSRFDLKWLVTPTRLSDAVVTLSSIDRTYWQNFNNNVFQVNNPFTGNYGDWNPVSCDGHDILWLARISQEKRPFDALAILQEVMKTIPDAKLHIVGSSWDQKYEKRFRKAIAEKKLTDNVILHGFQIEVIPYYKKGSLFLMTSEYEGYPMTLQESMASGLPIVMYALPHLTVTHDNPGIITVPQGDVGGAARVITRLLQNDEERKQMGREARKYMDGLMEYDYEGTWSGILDSLGKEHPSEMPEEVRSMMETLVLHHHIGLEKRQDAMMYGERKTVRTAVRVVKLKDSIHEKGLGYTLKKLVKKD